MRLAPDRYPEYVDFYCFSCDGDHDEVKVDSIEGDDVFVYCPKCDEPSYVRVIE